MSTDWGIGCRTCRAAGPPDAPRETYFTGEWDNCRDEDALRKLIGARTEIVAVDAALGGQYVSFFWTYYAHDTNCAYDIAAFFRTHAGHDLAPMNEYGDFANDRRKPVDCAECATRHRCRRDHGHDGEHSPRA